MGCGCNKNKGAQAPLANPQRGFQNEPAKITPGPEQSKELKEGLADGSIQIATEATGTKIMRSGLAPSQFAHDESLRPKNIPKQVPPPPVKEPGLLRKALNLGEAIVDHVVDGMKKTTKEELALRLTLCDECHHKTSKNTCALCGCGIAAKAGWRSSECPDKRWPILKETEHGDN
tara:strand:- start:223 stop:747 length:525 start_codon:yes stop_codon:yes gene_type:complete